MKLIDVTKTWYSSSFSIANDFNITRNDIILLKCLITNK